MADKLDFKYSFETSSLFLLAFGFFLRDHTVPATVEVGLMTVTTRNKPKL